MKIFQEFKQFAMKGNVVDLAIGIIIGAAFGRIVSSLVNDLLMPPLGLALGGVNFTDLKVVLKAATVDAAGNPVQAVTMNYGIFIQTIIDFVIIAFAIFLLVKGMNRMKKKEEATPAAPPVTNQEKLLAEIRDLLKR